MRPRSAFLAQAALVAAATGWIAALYGALYIYAAADFTSTGSFWIFGWPFLLALLVATGVNLFVAGAGGRRLPSPLRWVNAINRLLESEASPEDASVDELRWALARLPLFPIVNCICAMLLGVVVTAWMVGLEWLVAGTMRNVGPISFAGTIATLTYGATNFAVGDLLVARRCARLRLAGVRRGIDPYAGPAIHTWARVITLAAPTVLALMIASRLAADAQGSWLAHATIIVAGSTLVAALAWLQTLTIRTAAEDLGAAAGRLTRGEEAHFVTGSTDAHLVAMARAFNRAATEVDHSLRMSAARYSALVQQLTAQNAELRAAQERLTEADRLKSEFMGMMSHELRTPLNVFVGYTEMVLDAARENGAGSVAEHRDVLERMLEAAGLLTNLVEDTLSVLRLEGAGVRVSCERVSLQSLFTELEAAGRFLHAPNGVREHWVVEPDLPALFSDRMKLRQIVTNLVSNARKFTSAGSIIVRAFPSGRDEVAISVEDTGCGIAPDDLPFVFDLYRQAGNGTVSHNGCGIGLYIVRRYCQVLGGRVDLESEMGKGTRITIHLPRLEVEGLEREGGAGGYGVRG